MEHRNMIFSSVSRKLHKSSYLHLKCLIYVLRKVHQKQDFYHIVGYNVQCWYQVTLFQPTGHMPLPLEIFQLLPKLVTHIASNIYYFLYVLLC